MLTVCLTQLEVPCLLSLFWKTGKCFYPLLSSYSGIVQSSMLFLCKICLPIKITFACDKSHHCVWNPILKYNRERNSSFKVIKTASLSFQIMASLRHVSSDNGLSIPCDHLIMASLFALMAFTSKSFFLFLIVKPA